MVGEYEAVVPTLSGTSWITGFAQYVVDPEDPFPNGSTVGDIWSSPDDGGQPRSLVPERHDRVDTSGSSGRDVGRNERDAQQEGWDPNEGDEVG